MARGLEITLHAIERYQQRVEDVPAAVVVARLRGPAFDAAAKIGKCSVILSTGHRAVFNGGAVVTILPRHRFAGRGE